jgi:hypothetical protein
MESRAVPYRCIRETPKPSKGAFEESLNQVLNYNSRTGSCYLGIFNKGHVLQQVPFRGLDLEL